MLKRPFAPVEQQQWLRLFDAVHKLCTGPPPFAAQLYERVQSLLAAHVDGVVSFLELAEKPEQLLLQYDAEWQSFQDVLHTLHGLLGRLNSSYTKTHGRLGPAPRPVGRGAVSAPRGAGAGAGGADCSACVHATVRDAGRPS